MSSYWVGIVENVASLLFTVGVLSFCIRSTLPEAARQTAWWKRPDILLIAAAVAIKIVLLPYRFIHGV